ncbi:MAG: hypothetical protein AB7K09_06890 [Planctomycetota bacterium]
MAQPRLSDAPPRTAASTAAAAAAVVSVPPASPARTRADARLVVLSATLVACTRPWSRFEVSRRPGGLVLLTVEPDGRTLRHVIPISGVQVPALARIARCINELGVDALTGRSGLYAVQASGRSTTRELVQCAARVFRREDDAVLQLDLPLVIRQFEDGSNEIYRPLPLGAAKDEPTWVDF